MKQFCFLKTSQHFTDLHRICGCDREMARKHNHVRLCVCKCTHNTPSADRSQDGIISLRGKVLPAYDIQARWNPNYLETNHLTFLP